MDRYYPIAAIKTTVKSFFQASGFSMIGAIWKDFSNLPPSYSLLSREGELTSLSNLRGRGARVRASQGSKV